MAFRRVSCAVAGTAGCCTMQQFYNFHFSGTDDSSIRDRIQYLEYVGMAVLADTPHHKAAYREIVKYADILAQTCVYLGHQRLFAIIFERKKNFYEIRM